MIKYKIEYQYRPTGTNRPYDESYETIEATDENGVVILPNVGDYIEIGDPAQKGKVSSRLFTYLRTKEALWCVVNIVFTDTNDDWGKLLKQ